MTKTTGKMRPLGNETSVTVTIFGCQTSLIRTPEGWVLSGLSPVPFKKPIKYLRDAKARVRQINGKWEAYRKNEREPHA
jgi:hypothetical protein